MSKNKSVLVIVCSLICIAFGVANAGDHPSGSEHPTAKKEHPAKEHPQASVEDQIAGLQKMCTESADARAERQEAKPLFERMGGEEKTRALFADVVARHRVNEDIKQYMDGVDDEKLVNHLVDFVSAGTGGGGEYKGRSMTDSHAHLKLTDADFLAAGRDVVAGMKAAEYGEEEIQEFMCVFVSLKDQVVFK
ncbi:MAG: hemoglobin [Candidatus Krumholzibacteriia bacterium]